MNQPERAVAYLERHGRLRLAAELAEARMLPAGLVVRHWFLAGFRERAIAIAVREQAFEDAIDRLARSGQKEAAAALRLLHADRLASAGRWLAAARLIHRQKEGVPLALRWLELARLAGDTSGLALELSIEPARFASVYTALTPLLADRGPEAVPLRARLATELLELQAHAAKPIARELTRELFADAAQLGDRGLAASASKLADWIGGAFSADQPAVVTFERRLSNEPTVYRYAAHDTGARRIFDVHQYGSRFAVALGEAGVALVDRMGKRIAHFDVPAEALVVSEDGSRLLALAQRGDAQRVSQIDLATRRSQAWGELQMGAAARTFDGQTWLIASPPGTAPELLLLDVLDASPSVLRRIPLPDGVLAVSALQLVGQHCEVIAKTAHEFPDRLRFELPSWTLRRRSTVSFGPANVAHTWRHASAVVPSDPPLVLASWFPRLGENRSGVWLRNGESELQLPFAEKESHTLALWADGNLFAAALSSEHSGTRVLIGQLLGQRILLDIQLETTRALQIRLSMGRALICDDAGRLLGFDLSAARCIHDLRL